MQEINVILKFKILNQLYRVLHQLLLPQPTIMAQITNPMTHLVL
jgi:hypothetical protein